MDILTLMLATFTLMQMTASQDCNFGASCRFPCNCQPSSDTCDEVTGNCPGGCKVGSPSDYDWVGHGCLTGNVAYDKDATQNGIARGLTAAGAVDGSTDTVQGCSHPLSDQPPSGLCPSNGQCQNAWWQVDLGRLHRITRVIIVNTERTGGENIRMNHIVIKVSNSTNVTDTYQCSIFDDTMDSGETRSFDCTAPLIGRYVTLFKYSNTSEQGDLIGSFTVCEVIVIGNIYKDCDECQVPDVCTGQYGCMASCHGWEPDTLCNTECQDGSYGVNCRFYCGRCYNNIPCSKQTGVCPGGCQLWWAEDMCSVRIAEVNFDASSRVSVTATRSNQFSISWRAIPSIRQDISRYYSYNIEYKKPFESSWTHVENVAHSHNMVYEETVRDVTYNTQYTARVTPYRTHRGQTDGGTAITATLKTSCVEPDRPEIRNIADTSPAGDRGLERISVSWRLPLDSRSGCDYIDTGSCAIRYRLRNTASWSSVNCGYFSTSTTIRVSAAGTYDVSVRVSNNEGVISTSSLRPVTIENIVPVEFRSSNGLSIKTFSSDQIEVSWNAINSIPPADSDKFGYQLEYKLTSDTQQSTPWIIVTSESHVPGQTYVLTVPGLTYNSRYTIRVRPYRIYRSNRIYETGISIVQKTACIEPDPPTLTSVTVIDPEGVTGLERVSVSWSVPASGCNNLQTCVVHYVISGTQDVQQCSTTAPFMGTEIIEPRWKGEYDVYVKITNNENLFSTSETRTIIIRDIQAAGFRSSDVIDIVRTLSYEITFSWTAIATIRSDDEMDFGYRVYWLAKAATDQSKNWIQLRTVPHRKSAVYEEKIVDLTFNTMYAIKVTPFRNASGNIIDGNPIEIERKTACIAPDEPRLANMTVIAPLNETGIQRVYVAWRVPQESGCSTFNACTVHVTARGVYSNYSCLPSPGPGTMIISPSEVGEIGVHLEIVNNEYISSKSDLEVEFVREIVPVTRADPLLAVYIVVPLLVIVIAVVAFLIVRKRSRRPLAVAFKLRRKQPSHMHMQPPDSPDNSCPKPKPKPRPPVKTGPTVPEKTNHAYSNHLIISNVLSKAELEHYFSDLVKRNKLKAAYDAIPKQTEASCDIARKQVHVSKNRYKNIMPYDDTRVKLPLVHDQDNTDYINANIVTGYPGMAKDYIAAQGPKIETVDDFWRMVVDRNVRQIVMLTLCKELNKKLCEPYWPEDGSSTKYFGDIQVRINTTAVTAHYTVRTFTVHTQNIQMRVTQYQIISWKDKTKPDSPLPMYDLLHRVRARARESDQGTLLVHCSAGVGRTGTYIALDYLLDQLAAENQLDIDGTIHKLRNQRPLLVQTLNQYSFIYEFLIMYCKVGHSHVTTKQLADSLFISENNFEQTFKSLMRLKSEAPTAVFQGASPENRSKNRNPHMIPSDDVRLYLSLPCEGSNDYINAALVDSFWHTRSLILTQVPLQNTIVDFWRLVYDHEVATVVLLDQLKPDDKYWPTDTGIPHSHGPLEVLLQRKSMSPKISHYDLRVSRTTRPDDGQDLRLYQLHGWYSSASVPPNAQHVLDLLDTIQIPIKTGNRFIIQCLDGVSHCGLFCAGSHVVAQSQMWTEVDVPLAVMTVRERRQDYITNKAQFEFLHQLVHTKLSVSQGAIYANLPQGQALHREPVYANTESVI